MAQDKKNTPSTNKTNNRSRSRSRSRSRNRNRNNAKISKTQEKERQEKKSRAWQKISEHFSLKDFADNNPETEGDKKPFKISLGLIGGLELLRSLSQKRVSILKGFEHQDSGRKNQKNYHCLGLAADIRIQDLSAKDTFLLVQKIPEFKGIGLNLEEDYVHVDNRKEEERCLWIEKDKKQIEWTEALEQEHFGNTTTEND
eukprot:COSAG01_NODE_3_length_63519_cov_1591.007663_27_plen_200_part_00